MQSGTSNLEAIHVREPTKVTRDRIDARRRSEEIEII